MYIIYIYIYIVKSFSACSLTKYKIEKNYIIFSQNIYISIYMYIYIYVYIYI